MTAVGMAPTARHGAIAGVFRDSSGRPASGVVIRAIGTHRQVVTGSDGSYRLDSLPPGALSLVGHALEYDALAILAASRRLDVRPGRVERVDFRAPTAAALRREVCPLGPPTAYSRPRVRGVLRLLMVDSASVMPIPGVRFIVTWPAIMENPGADSTRELYRQAVTDSRGAATFCDLPWGFPLEVSVLGPGGSRGHVMMTEVSRNGIVARIVSGRVNR